MLPVTLRVTTGASAFTPGKSDIRLSKIHRTEVFSDLSSSGTYCLSGKSIFETKTCAAKTSRRPWVRFLTCRVRPPANRAASRGPAIARPPLHCADRANFPRNIDHFRCSALRYRSLTAVVPDVIQTSESSPVAPELPDAQKTAYRESGITSNRRFLARKNFRWGSREPFPE